MLDKADWQRCHEDDPERCQATGTGGEQCKYKSTSDTKYCPRHMHHSIQQEKKKRISAYQLQQYNARFDKFAEDSEIKSLRGEIGILRMSLEAIINQTNGNVEELVGYSGKINETVNNINRLILSADRLDERMKKMINKDTLIIFAQKLIEIFVARIKDEELIEDLTKDLENILSDDIYE